MSEEEFLKRWSRRKQEARTGEQPPPSAPAEAAEATLPQPPEVGSEPEIDLSKLPPLDSITAATDITEFLRKGIPAELSRAALRRAWAADPAIRDFVGLAENAWDFTDPNAMPGFGALQESPEQIGAMVERVLGGVRDAAEKLARQGPEEAENPAMADETVRVPAEPDALPGLAARVSLSEEASEEAVAAQPETSVDEHDELPLRRRTHGGALPR